MGRKSCLIHRESVRSRKLGKVCPESDFQISARHGQCESKHESDYAFEPMKIDIVSPRRRFRFRSEETDLHVR
ncbi:hypothetical protein SBA5_30006 [Candidatus Sulfotelmatomonas gaucii]|uniref:Uncharacterized protein n=1 Tax=Candidatus Sulfuritelmatomonas gaucii TaxID=2043161 RepID=A0A2N9LC32_9BACT|nr:hypothetical protein SBA5_30006 [Candidatus Sulfotelmatomonas gaucii]